MVTIITVVGCTSTVQALLKLSTDMTFVINQCSRSFPILKNNKFVHVLQTVLILIVQIENPKILNTAF